ncbi:MULTISPECIES: hypothetical protein [Argonema]|uniref:hypothetical protein n=1 Tax=Argonema TaxID=2942761 RepID=UPI00201306BD|nr:MULTISPECIES: hypothetical protein [Argonema]MCL1463975.1 hypothetical protein [Argonema galeatum A003/A1]MCL1470968.1 hypothetical protein [Argonema antarcticum A004/B2]
MTETKPTRIVRRGRIFPEIQWSEEKKAQWKAEQEAFHKRCQVIFDRVQPELIKTHYNWYIAVEPDSGDYFINKNELTAINMSRHKHPNAPVYIFRINETGVAGTI